ncbi:MAG: glycoside hydrolase family 31 protein, partial [Rikenellaceae bacterium]
MIQLQISKQKSFVNSLLLLTLLASAAPTATYAAIQNEVKSQKEIVGFEKLNSTTIDILFSNKERMSVDFYGENIFRLFQDNTGGILRDPQAEPEAQILVDNPRKAISKLEVEDNDGVISITTNKINLKINKESQLITATNLITNRVVFESVEPVTFKSNKTSIKLKEHDDEYFYGGGVQNGRFSHKGNSISIENQNSWTDGGVASPNPYYWSTNGYAAMWYTFKKGTYDFGAKEEGVVELTHESDYLDLFLMVNDGMVALLNDFYQLTGHPVLLPKFGFYQGHLNAYNRDYWVEDENGVAFEDGKKYKESQKDNGGIKESLNGENDNYQFSARAVIDRYKQHDMPFGWILPNDGYGAGYGQTDSLDGNIQNLKELHNYAVENGVEIGLWTQSDLHPKEGVSALLQRDIVKEVRDAGVRVLKTDVAWVGAGYSFGLNGVADVANIMQYYGNDSRPFIISLDGWAGTQRHAGIWSGDQTGGNWEYIRFHIPTYLGSGLSGQPNICSDMDGIFGGQKPIINTRDFQWKTFSPMQLNMDGWGSNPKYPHALGEPVTSINRWYLKLKAELMPYAYSIAKEAIDGKPMIRAMFVDYPNSYTLGKETQYQFMYGDYFLVAPIYQDTKSDEDGNDIRNGIYLPEGVWIDYFTGEKYEGGCIVSNFDSPLWKLPVFVKVGAIIPLNNPHNNVSEIDHTLRIYELYPAGTTSFTEYDDDGTTQAYLAGEGVTTLIESTVNDKNSAIITVNPTKGNFEGFEKNKATEFRVNVTEQPKKITAKVGAQKIKLAEAASIEEFNAGANLYFYDETPNLNKFATEGSEFEKEIITKNPMVLVKIDAIDVTRNATTLTIDGYVFNPADKHRVTSGVAATPKAEVSEENTQAYTLLPTWEDAENADFYEIKFQDMLYTTITDNSLLFESLEAETEYTFEIRSANKDGYSDWATFSATTKSNPLEFAITGIKAVCSAPGQGGSGIEKLFDFDETRGWHTRWGNAATPFDIIIDL